MKMMKRVFSIVLCFAMLSVCSVGASAESLSANAIMQRNYESTDGYTKLFETFELNGSTANPAYPEAYGGAYIDDSGNLVVQSVESSANMAREATIFTNESLSEVTGLQTVEIETVEYSYNQLVIANNEIGEHITKVTEAGAVSGEVKKSEVGTFKGEIVQTAIDAKNNTVVVWLDDISADSIESFRKEIYDAPYLTFELAVDERPTYQTAYEAGGGLVNSIGSIGFPATFGSYSGFVTAWHCSKTGTNYINGQAYGTRVDGSLTYDYAFIHQTNYTDTVSRGLYDTTKTLKTYTYSFLVQGSEVGRTGYITGYRTGKVTYTGVYNNLGDDLMATDCGAYGGDSGGPYFGSPSSATPSIAGIHIGGYNDTSINTTYFRGFSYLFDAGYRIKP